MATRFEALSDHDVSPRRGCFFGFASRADLTKDQASGITQPAHDVRSKVPEYLHSCDTLRDHGFKFGLEKIGGRGGRNEIHAEIPSCRRADASDFRPDEVRSLTHHAEETKAARRAYGCHQF